MKRGYERTLEVGIGELAVIEHQDNGRKTKEVEQVNTDAQSGHVGDKHQPAVAVRLVGMVFPF